METPPSYVLPSGFLPGPDAWRGADLVGSREWIRELTPAEAEELGQAAEGARRRGRELQALTADHFALPVLGPALVRLRTELLWGRGFVLLRGLPTSLARLPEAAWVFWALGTHLGRAVPQNGRGHVLGHVRDLGYDAGDPHVRLYQTNRRQGFHTDSADLVGLMCLQPARRGGRSALAATPTVYNEVRARRPDLVPVLFEPWHTDHRGEVPPGGRPYFSIPILTFHDGRLTGCYQRSYIESAQRFPDVPRLTDRQIEALDLLDAVLDDPDVHLEMDLQPGDIQLVHNHQILHDRTAFEDWPEPERQRHLLRLWLAPPEGRALPSCFAERLGSVEVGRRGGVSLSGVRPVAPLQAV
jgi:TfdA family taurine catabolism dioxygenase TauD